MVRTLVIAAALCAAVEGAALGGAATASEKPPSQAGVKKLDPSGIYLCEGVNPDGHRYRGIVQIAAVRNTFLVRWTLSDDVEVTGVGILHSNELSVSYFGGTPAVVVYRIDADKLVGEWTMGGTEGTVYAETLTRMPEGTLPPPSPSQAPSRPRRPGRSVPLPGSSPI
jgi:hypothetical protein